MKYMVQLDSIRAFAVMAVMYQHFYSDKMPTIFNRPLYWGSVGVELFFVLSGFLITNILLSYKDSIDSNKETVSDCLKKFYYRRTLRIFPIYYLLLTITFFLAVNDIRETIYWHLSYLSNIYFFTIGKWPPTKFVHFWSLAVEEQFYLFWPWIILLTPRSKIIIPIMAMIVAGPAYRFFCLYVIGASKFATDILTFGCLDLLGTGALLALLKNENYGYGMYKEGFLRIGLAVGGSFGVALFLIKGFILSPLIVIFFRLFEASFFAWILSKASEGIPGKLGEILEWRWLVFIGKISYGIYLYHAFSPLIVRHFTGAMGVYEIGTGYEFLLCITLSICIASASWYLIEAPIQRLKDHFQNVPLRIQPEAAIISIAKE